MPANFKPWILDIFTIYNLIFTGAAAGPTDRQLCGVRLRSTAEPGHLCGHQAIVSIWSPLTLKRMYTVNLRLSLPNIRYGHALLLLEHKHLIFKK